MQSGLLRIPMRPLNVKNQNPPALVGRTPLSDIMGHLESSPSHHVSEWSTLFLGLGSDSPLLALT